MYQNQYNYREESISIKRPPYIDKYGREFYTDSFGRAYTEDNYGNTEYLKPLPFIKRHFLAVRQYKTLWKVLTFMFITPILVLIFLAWNAFLGIMIATWYIIKALFYILLFLFIIW